MQSEKQLIQAFTGKSCLQDSSAHQWAEITAKYPAFTLGHYFRAKKQLTEQKANPAADKQAQNRSLQQAAATHFNDILWLDYLLKQDFSPVEAIQSTKQAPVLEPAKSGDKAHSAPFHTNSTNNKGETLEPLTGNAAVQEVIPNSVAATTNEVEVEAPAPQSNRLTAVLSAQLADFKKPLKEDARLEVEREPLYKVDYFASQGISILKNQDGLDKKVRKFTDWLKEMKQQTPDNNGVPKLNTTPQEEAQAAQKAEASLKIAPIWTESMAEVLISQGKSAQAREVYQKLSLLYPEKSAYFASKIDLLQ